MSEESILTKEETVKNIAETTITDTSTAVSPSDADASNIVPFASEASVSQADGPKIEEPVPPAPEKAPESTVVKESAAPSAAVPEAPAANTGNTFQKAAARIKPEEEDTFPEEDAPSKKRFHFKKDDKEFFRDKWILSRIDDDHLMDYLKLEQRRNELQQQAKDIKEKRILKTFELTAALAAIVAVIYLLKDNPSILINILYIAGILTAFWFWKNPHDK